MKKRRQPDQAHFERQKLPSYASLPDGLAWEYFGDEDQSGTINLLTPQRIADAARLVHRGATFNLDLPLHVPLRPFGTRRRPPRHIITELRDGKALDDHLEEFFPQYSSQWDGLSHASCGRHGFYNGVQRDQITGGPETKLGIEHWAEHGIVGRGVLLDVARHCELHRREPIDPTSRFLISVELLEETAETQGVGLRTGDILMVRTGVAAHLLDEAERSDTRPVDAGFSVPGLQPGMEMVAWLWDRHFAAVTADNFSVEAWPFTSDEAFMHATLIPDLGLALGELFNFEQLAEDCDADGVYECFFVASPLNLRGGVGSPANALAFK